MGTVKYTGPVASFHCPTNAEIRSLKVHFSPKQLGEGDPSPENVREIVGWDGVVVHNDTDGIVIPEEYQKVEYLQSDSAYAMYINTGVSIASDVEMEMQISVLNVIGGKYLLGRYINNNDGDFYLYTSAGNNTYFQTAYGCTYNNTSKVCDTSKHTFRFNITNNMTYVYCDGTDVLHKTILNTITERPILVAGTSMGEARLSCNTYWVRISKGGVLIRNLIPCRRKSDDKPGMYDTVSQTFFTNQGTGEFVCGPGVGQTTDYEFGVLGKNKFDGEWELGGINTTTGQNSPASDSIRTKNMIPVAPGEKYTISRSDTTSFYMLPFAYKKDGSFSRYLGAKSATPIILSMDDDEYYLKFYLYQRTTPLENCQIELGSTATTYEPYDPKHTVYGGWVDLITGEVCDNWWTVTWEIGADEGTIQTSGLRKIAKNLPSAHLCDTSDRTKSVCSQLIYSGINGDTRPNFNLSKSTGYMYIPDDNTAYTFEILYPSLTTTATYHLAPTQLQTFLGHNNVWSNTDYVEVEYDLHETQDILNRKNFIIANQPHIVRPAAAPLQNFTTDVAAPLKECKVYFEPVQDLHGYSNPWPAGGGKNVFPYPYVDTTKTDNGITFTDLGDGQIKITGTNDSSGYVYFVLRNDLDFGDTYNSFSYVAPSFVNGDYILKFFGMTSGVGAEYFGNGLVRFRITSGATVDTAVGPTIYKTSNNLSAFVPYKNVCPISGWTGVEVYKAGKNLIDPTHFFPKSQLAGGAVKAATAYGIYSVPIPKNKTIYWSKTVTSASAGGLADTAATIGVPYYNGATNTNRFSYTWQSKNHSYLLLMMGNTSTDGGVSRNEMVCLDDDRNYALPTGTTLPIDWTDSAGTVYGGYVDLVKGEIVEEWYKIVADGVNVKANSGYVSSNGESFGAGIVYTNPRGLTRNYNSAEMIRCDLLPVNSNIMPFVYVPGAGKLYVVFYLFNTTDYPNVTTNAERIEMTNAWLQEHPVTIVYKLSEPIHHSITPQTLKTLRGTNNIWANNNGGNIEVAFWRH